MKKVLSFIIAIAIPLLVGVVSALLTMNNMDVYSTVNQPPLTPPALVFPIVWTVLFTLMGVSSALVYNSYSNKKDDAFFVYAVSLGLNFLWSIIFFNFRQFILSFIVLVALLISIIATIVKYFKINKVASLLQIPYAVWVAFAGYLNFAIILLN